MNKKKCPNVFKSGGNMLDQSASKEGRTENLLSPDNNFEFLKHFMNILLLA